MASAKKRILHLLDSGGMYGAESVVINLSREMVRNRLYVPVVGCIVQDSNVDVDLFDIARKYGIESYKIVINNYLLFRDLPRFVYLLKKLRINLIHTHGYKASVFAFMAKLFTGINIMATCHLWYEGKGRPLKMRLMVALEKYIYRYYPVIVGVSDDIVGVLSDVGLSKNKLRIVNNGIVLSDYSRYSDKTVQRIAAELDLQIDDLCVLSVGRLTEQKAHCHIVSAANLVRMEIKNVKFLIVGEGSLREKLQQQIKSLNLESYVKMLGFRDDIPVLMQMADLFVLPSLDEGMPIALLEAAASGLPVITTAVGDIPKLIINDISGIIVKVNDINGMAYAITNLLADNVKRNELANQAWIRVQERYSSKSMYAQYDEIYEGIFFDGI